MEALMPLITIDNMALTEQEQKIVLFGKENGKSPSEIVQAISSYRQEQQKINIDASNAPKEGEMGYLKRVATDFKTGFSGAKEDINSTDSRSDFSKGLSAATKVASAIVSPVLEAPVIKQVGEFANKAINFTADEVAKLYSPEFKASLANMSDEEFQKATQPLQDIANLGSIANDILAIKGTAEATKTVPSAVSKVKKATSGITPPDATGAVKNITEKINSVVKPIKEAVQDITPTKEVLRDKAFARAFKLAPVEDLAQIEQMTGNKPAAWTDKYQLIKNTPAETTESIAKFKRENLNIANDAISLVPDEFTFEDMPQLKTTIDFLKKDLQGRESPEYKQVLGRIQNIESAGKFNLMDAQYIKNVFDDVESIYKKTGDVRDALLAQDKANTIAPVRRFIEDRVKEYYPQIDIRSLNNNIQTASAIIDAIVKRAPKAETSSLFQLGDMAVIGVGNQIVPGTGFAALFGKKIIESAPIQLRIASYLAGKTKDITKGMSLEEINNMNAFIQEELKTAMDAPTKAELEAIRKQIKKAQSKAKPKQ